MHNLWSMISFTCQVEVPACREFWKAQLGWEFLLQSRLYCCRIWHEAELSSEGRPITANRTEMNAVHTLPPADGRPFHFRLKSIAGILLGSFLGRGRELYCTAR